MNFPPNDELVTWGELREVLARFIPKLHNIASEDEAGRKLDSAIVEAQGLPDLRHLQSGYRKPEPAKTV